MFFYVPLGDKNVNQKIIVLAWIHNVKNFGLIIVPKLGRPEEISTSRPSRIQKTFRLLLDIITVEHVAVIQPYFHVEFSTCPYDSKLKGLALTDPSAVLTAVRCPSPAAPSCSVNEYVCASGGCVSASLRCDGHDNCLDGSDEVSAASREIFQKGNRKMPRFVVFFLWPRLTNPPRTDVCHDSLCFFADRPAV